MKLRLPLQVGTTACWSIARCATIFLPSLVFLVFAGPVIVGVTAVGTWEALKTFDPKVALTIVVVGAAGVLGIVAFVRSAVKHLALAMRERPSDVELDGGTIRVIGGPLDGLQASLSGAKCRLQTEQKERMRLFDFAKGEPLATEKLELVSLAIDGRTVATAARPIEKESLRALFETIETQRQRLHPGKAPGPRGKPKVQILACAACGGLVVPQDETSVACGHCRAPVPVPADLRQRLRAQKVLAGALPRNEARLLALLQQPRASTVGGVMLVLALPILLVWPATAVAIYALYHRGTLGALNVAMLVPTALAAILAFFFLMRASVVDRQALSIVSARFGALAPQKEGDPHQCRSCLGPLPAAPDKLLVHCAYCGAENITGLDLRSDAGREVKQERGLQEELGRRGRERTIWALLAAASFAGLAGTRWSLPVAFAPHGDRARCRAGEALACLRDGRAREALDKAADDDGDDDVAAALDAFQIGCKLGDVAACREVARMAYTWGRYAKDESLTPALVKGCDLGDGRACGIAGNRRQKDGDLSSAVALYRRGSDLGYAGATNDLGFLVEKGNGVAKDEAGGLALYQKACDQGFLLGCSNAAWVHEHAQTPDFARATALHERACATGNAGRCVDAADYFARRCEVGDAPSCKRTVDIYSGLKGDTTKDETRAYHVACVGGYADGCNREGVVTQDKDSKLARELFTKACDGGSADGCNNLGVAFVKGYGGSKSLKAALDHYERGCRLGSKLACGNEAGVRAMLAGH